MITFVVGVALGMVMAAYGLADQRKDDVNRINNLEEETYLLRESKRVLEDRLFDMEQGVQSE